MRVPAQMMTCRAGCTRLQVGAVALQLRRARSQLHGAPGFLHRRRGLCRRSHLRGPQLFAHQYVNTVLVQNKGLARSSMPGTADTEHTQSFHHDK